MADAGHGTKTQHHLLVDVKDRDQQRERPQKRRAVILTGLRVGAKGAGVIVADHDDEPGSENREQCLQLGDPAGPRRGVAVQDRAERTVDVADLGSVEDDPAARRGGDFADGGHLFLLSRHCLVC